MWRLPGLASLFLLVSATTVSAQRGNLEAEFEARSIDQMIAPFMKENQIPGMTLVIVPISMLVSVFFYFTLPS
jgi:hypothetical protein